MLHIRGLGLLEVIRSLGWSLYEWISALIRYLTELPIPFSHVQMQ